MPREVQQQVELELQTLIHIYSLSVLQGKQQEFWNHLREFAGDQILHFADAIRAERAQAGSAMSGASSFTLCPKCKKAMPKGMKCITCA